MAKHGLPPASFVLLLVPLGILGPGCDWLSFGPDCEGARRHMAEDCNEAQADLMSSFCSDQPTDTADACASEGWVSCVYAAAGNCTAELACPTYPAAYDCTGDTAP